MNRNSLGKQQRAAAKAERALPEPLTTVCVVNGVNTSAGPGPGPKRLPPGEAAALVRSKHALYGDQPPKGGHL